MRIWSQFPQAPPFHEEGARFLQQVRADQADRMKQLCEEIRVFEGMAERTGEMLELRGLKAHMNGCTSMRDLVRKYRIFGDGHFYLPLGNWPTGKLSVSLDNVKWIGLDRTFQARQRFAPTPKVDDDA
jgi:hypothetical protein